MSRAEAILANNRPTRKKLGMDKQSSLPAAATVMKKVLHHWKQFPKATSL